MGRFHTPLRVELVDQATKARWRLLEPLVFYSELVGDLVTVPADFETDFASVPRLPYTYMLAGDTAHAAATVHDWLYHGGMPGVRRATADEIFFEAMVASGVVGWRRNLMLAAVQLFGRGAWKGKG